MHSDFQTYRFVLIVSISAAFLLSITSTSLLKKQKYNFEVDRIKNVLKCAAVDLFGMNSDDIISKYKSVIREKVLSLDGSFNNIPIDNLVATEIKSTGQVNYEFNQIEYLPLFEYHIDSKLKAYIIPISGKGLWSTLFGYIALENDLNTIMGITFYKHKETPGLGGEIVKDWFQSNFINKKLFNNNGEFKSINVIKGIATGSEIEHKVDGISGATMTCSGLTKFLYNDLSRYLPFIDKNIKDIEI